MSQPDYNTAPGVRWSDLSAALNSPKHLRHRLDTPREDKGAFRLGRVEHVVIGEPHREAEVVIAPDDLVTSTGRLSTSAKARAWLEERGNPDLVATEAEFDNARRMRDAVHEHEDAREWLRYATIREQAVTWTETVGGLDIVCKAKPDMVSPHLSLLIDLKRKTPRGDCLTVRACEGEIIARNYAAQLGFYGRGWHADPKRPRLDTVAWIFVDPRPPWDVICVYADEELAAYGEEQADLALRRYADGMVTGQWPGVAPRAVLASLPAYLRDDGDVMDLGLEGLTDE